MSREEQLAALHARAAATHAMPSLAAYAALVSDLLYALDSDPSPAEPAPLDVLPMFEVGQVVGELQPGRRRHDWCSMHGDIGPGESIDGHARKHHGSGAEAIRKARKVFKRASAIDQWEREYAATEPERVSEEGT